MVGGGGKEGNGTIGDLRVGEAREEERENLSEGGREIEKKMRS